VCVLLCGRRVRLPRGPWEMARRTDARILPVFSRRRRYDDFDVYLGEPYAERVSDSAEADIQRAAERFAYLLQARLLSDRGQWTVLEDFWQVHPVRRGLTYEMAATARRSSWHGTTEGGFSDHVVPPHADADGLGCP
jgi:lauroyl/myristoyl acyltransferase